MASNFKIETLKSNLKTYREKLKELDVESQAKEVKDFETKIKMAESDLQIFTLVFKDICSSRLFQIHNITSIFVLIHKVFY